MSSTSILVSKLTGYIFYQRSCVNPDAAMSSTSNLVSKLTGYIFYQRSCVNPDDVMFSSPTRNLASKLILLHLSQEILCLAALTLFVHNKIEHG
jgi:hypothetical protein